MKIAAHFAQGRRKVRYDARHVILQEGLCGNDVVAWRGKGGQFCVARKERDERACILFSARLTHDSVKIRMLAWLDGQEVFRGGRAKALRRVAGQVHKIMLEFWERKKKKGKKKKRKALRDRQI